MTKAKIIFQQTLMISTAILFVMGVQELLEKILEGDDTIVWQWYSPLAIILTGFLCSLPTLLLRDFGRLSRRRANFVLIAHFISVGALVTLCGYLFGWYSGWQSYLPIIVMYVLIYGFVWAATLWLEKKDEKKINEALKEIQDKE